MSQVDKLPFKKNCIPFFDDCVYKDYVEHDVFRNLSGYLKYFSDNINLNAPKPSSDLQDKAFVSIMHCAVMFKHHAFNEENEVRIAIRIPHKNRSNFKQNIKLRGDGVPYVELFNDIKNKLPIKRIIVGPHKEKFIRADKLKYVLKVKGLESIDVSVSDIPFR